MLVLAIDPGSTLSAMVWFDTEDRRVVDKCKISNDAVLERMVEYGPHHLAIEMAESFGAKVWGQVFTTVLWTGRFVQQWMAKPGAEHTLVTRREVKQQLAGSPRAKDGQIRNVLIDRWGGRDVAVGTRKAPGPLCGVTADQWQALAIAVTWADARGLKGCEHGER